jgi:hypothetical protein
LASSSSTSDREHDHQRRHGDELGHDMKLIAQTSIGGLISGVGERMTIDL